MDEQFLYAELFPSIVLVLISLACAEFIGRMKHIGFNYTLFMMIGIIPGIIALIFSPSAKNKPTKPNNIYFVFGVIFAILSIYQLYSIQGINTVPFTFMFLISLATTSFYFFDLGYGKVINTYPKFYFGTKDFVKEEIKSVSNFDSLSNLKEKGILTQEEFDKKTKILNQEILENKIKESLEYQQLNDLFELGVLTKEELEIKVGLLSNSEISTKINEFRIIDGYSEDLALAINSDLDYGFVDENKQIVIDFKFEHAENFVNGVAKVRYKGEFKNINKDGNFV